MAHKTKNNPMDENKIEPSQEELAAEQTALQETKEEDVRAHIVSEYGFDETDDAERITKLVAKEMDNRKNLSKAIGQKIKYRDAIKNAPKLTPPAPVNTDELEKRLEQKFRGELENRDLESLGYPEEITNEIKKVAKVLGVSVKQALA